MTVKSLVEDTHHTLADLFPRVSARPDGPTDLFSIAPNPSGFSLTGEGDGYRYQTTDPGTLVPSLEYRIREIYIARAVEYWALHSSGFLTGQGEAVLAIGKPGSGKSTLALRAVAAGACGLSDELHLWQPQEGIVVGYPGAYTIKEGTFRVFPKFRRMIADAVPARWDNHPLWYVNASRFGKCEAMKPVKLRALVLLDKQDNRLPLRVVPHWRRLSAVLSNIWIPKDFAFGERVDAIMAALEHIEVWEGGPDAVLGQFLGLHVSEPAC